MGIGKTLSNVLMGFVNALFGWLIKFYKTEKEHKAVDEWLENYLYEGRSLTLKNIVGEMLYDGIAVSAIVFKCTKEEGKQYVIIVGEHSRYLADLWDKKLEFTVRPTRLAYLAPKRSKHYGKKFKLIANEDPNSGQPQYHYYEIPVGSFRYSDHKVLEVDRAVVMSNFFSAEEKAKFNAKCAMPETIEASILQLSQK